MNGYKVQVAKMNLHLVACSRLVGTDEAGGQLADVCIAGSVEVQLVALEEVRSVVCIDAALAEEVETGHFVLPANALLALYIVADVLHVLQHGYG